LTGDAETPSSFLDELGRALKARDGVDAGLADILAEHILNLGPASDCVDQAMTAIKALAASRVAPAEDGEDV
jgi:hypothetical protein